MSFWTARGLERGFVDIESTVYNYRDLYWHPRLFERRFLGPWRAAGSPTFEQDAWEMARELIARHEYEAPEDIRAELERIYRRAEGELADAH